MAYIWESWWVVNSDCSFGWCFQSAAASSFHVFPSSGWWSKPRRVFGYLEFGPFGTSIFRMAKFHSHYLCISCISMSPAICTYIICTYTIHRARNRRVGCSRKMSRQSASPLQFRRCWWTVFWVWRVSCAVSPAGVLKCWHLFTIWEVSWGFCNIWNAGCI